MYRQQNNEVRGGKGYSTELAGRDRFKFFRRPVEAEGALPGDPMLTWGHNTQAQFASSYPSSATAPGAAAGARGLRDPFTASGSTSAAANRPSSMRAGNTASRRGRNHHLPRLDGAPSAASLRPGSSSDSAAALAANLDLPRDVGVQTKYREGEAQTMPYSPDFYIPDGAAEPEILGLQGLTWGSGLPAGREEVELIQRLRRRREVEAQLPTGDDVESVEKRFTLLHSLEEEEWADREAHMEKLQERRLAKMRQSLLEREAAREEVNRHRLEQIKTQYMETLGGRLATIESKGLADSRRAVDKKLISNLNGGQMRKSRVGTTKRDLIESYVKYGREAVPPLMDGEIPLDGRHAAAQSKRVENYDVRPQLLGHAEGVEEVDTHRAPRIERVDERAFTVPENEAIDRLPTLYQRHEAQRVVDSLEYANAKINGSDQADTARSTGQHVIDLYRATPKLQRPDTPELELDGDEDEDVEEACILLQRLLRGRAVQNDFFEGKERCRGLIEELQAASNAKYAERSLVNAKEREEQATRQRAMAQAVLDAAQGDIIGDTLGYLLQELDRQRDVQRLEALRVEAEAVRRTREAAEVARRETERMQRDKEEVQHAAYVRATDGTVDCFLQDMYTTAVEETALAEAVAIERERQMALSAPRNPTEQLDMENLVCDMLDGFIVPTIVEAIQLAQHELHKRAPAAAALETIFTAQRGDGDGGGSAEES